jgi:predicted dinucleotide-binding enzyme
MMVAIAGARKVGLALGGALKRAGNVVVFGVRTPDADVPEQMSIVAAVGQADAVILAVPFGAVADVAVAAGSWARL